MKLSKKNIQTQQKILDKKIKDLILLKNIPRPRSGWLKAIRTGLGISTRQMGERLGVTHQVILRMEKGEMEGSATLESLQKVAHAMDCKFIYAILPAKHESLNALLEEKALILAKRITKEVSHSMKMEGQGVDHQSMDDQINQLAKELKEALDPRLWVV
ncbi:MAG TPA: mobile mystery protein A [Oligoflexus sp.]|uniref:mobile mystery protein A n=1 Tax=Oligoflexus sp. TaxID=1971216 RepID=UPI002D5DBEEF|nr:mobile mystery protein A [Oligoflexus sp.]HYX32018.1 mobile mystery protein A [Oligoflexus sp.]